MILRVVFVYLMMILSINGFAIELGADEEDKISAIIQALREVENNSNILSAYVMLLDKLEVIADYSGALLSNAYLNYLLYENVLFSDASSIDNATSSPDFVIPTSSCTPEEYEAAVNQALHIVLPFYGLSLGVNSSPAKQQLFTVW